MNNILIFIILFLKIKLIYSQTEIDYKEIGTGYNIQALKIINEIEVVIFHTKEFYLSSLGSTIGLSFNATKLIKISNNEFIILGFNYSNTSNDNNIYYQIFNYTDSVFFDNITHKISFNGFDKDNNFVINLYNSTHLIIVYFDDGEDVNVYKIFNYKDGTIVNNSADDYYDDIFHSKCISNTIKCENIIDKTTICICERISS